MNEALETQDPSREPRALLKLVARKHSVPLLLVHARAHMDPADGLLTHTDMAERINKTWSDEDISYQMARLQAMKLTEQGLLEVATPSYRSPRKYQITKKGAKVLGICLTIMAIPAPEGQNGRDD